MFPPTEDRSNETKSRLMEQITTALGGRAAEATVFGLDDISTGASNDLEVATSIARDMVTEYGMSELGPLNLKKRGIFGLWQPDGEGSQISENLQAKIDEQVKKIMDQAYKQSEGILRKNRSKLDRLASELLDKETLDTFEFEKIVGKKKNGKEPLSTTSAIMA